MSACLTAELIHEPFNWRRYPEHLSVHLQYVRGSDQHPQIVAALDAARRKLGPSDGDPKVCLIKDVHIGLALDFICTLLKPRVLITCRHPCALADSWSRLGYEVSFRIDTLLSQPVLIEEHLRDYVSHIKSRSDYYFQLGAYWGAFYEVLDRLSRLRQDWVWCVHEELCANPSIAYASVLARLGLPVRGSLDDVLAETNTDSASPYDARRITRAQPGKWQSSLTAPAMQAVIDGARPFPLFSRLYR